MVAGGLAFALGLLAVDVPLKYERFVDDGSSGFHPRGYVFVEKSAKAPAGDWKLPALTSPAPVYACADIGGGKRLLVLDVQNAKDRFYNRLYFDANGNNDLRDDPVVDLPKPSEEASADQQEISSAAFTPVDFTVDRGTYKLPFCVRPIAYWGAEMPAGGLTAKEIESDSFVVYLLLNGCYRGECELQGVKYKLVLSDNDVNGVIEPKVIVKTIRGESQPCGDWLYIASGEQIGYRDWNFLGSLLVLKSTLYDVRLDAAKSVLSIEPSKAAGVKAAFPFDMERLSLVAEDGVRNVMLIDPGASAVIPAGKYRPCSYRGVKKDNEGDRWRVEMIATADTPYIEIGPNGANAAFGTPFTVKAVVPKFYYDRWTELAKKNEETRKQLLLSLEIEGAAHERIVDLAHFEGTQTKIALENNGQRPKEPTYSIATTDGTVVGTGSFNYG